MQIPDFSPWVSDISSINLPAALAAAGVMWSSSVYAYPFPDDPAIMADEIRGAIRAARAGNLPVKWSEPYFLYDSSFVRHTQAEALVEAWSRAIQGETDIRIEMHIHSYAYLTWYTSQLEKPGTKIVSTYCYEKPSSPYLSWRWPLRIGFFEPSPENRLSEDLQYWSNDNQWARPLFQVIDSTDTESAIDILFVTDGDRLEDLLETPARIVNSVCVLGINEDSVERLYNDFQRLVPVTQAKAFILAEPGGLSFWLWFNDLLQNLSHDLPLDRFLNQDAQAGATRSRAYLFGSQFIIQAARPSSMVRKLKEDLRQEPDKIPKALVERMKDFLPRDEYLESLSDDAGEGEEPGRSLESLPFDGGAVPLNALENLKYDHESQGASLISNLNLVADSMSKAPKEKQARFLQHQLTNSSSPSRQEVTYFEPGEQYLLTIRIGPSAAEWTSLQQSFPDDLLPQSDTGHILTVVFSEPNHFESPMSSTIFYPASGPSTPCEFNFGVQAEAPIFEGRILVLYRNRILQTALLRGPVARGNVSAREGAGIEFGAEGVVRSGNLELNGRTSFGSAILLNHTSSGERKATIVENQTAYQVDLSDITRLSGLSGIVSYITGMFNMTKWENSDDAKTDPAQTLNLLRNMAVIGKQLYDVLNSRGVISKSIIGNKPVQVVISQEGDYFPIDFCYEREKAPKSTAQLCPRWKENLENSTSCSGSCGDDPATQVDYVCPAAFWGLSRVIEWHRYLKKDPQADDGTSGLNNEPVPGNDTLPPLAKILIGASNKIPKPDVGKLTKYINDQLKVQSIEVNTWKDWEKEVGEVAPDTLILMVHTEEGIPSVPNMEIQGELRDPPNIDPDVVDASGTVHPLVLLLGCETQLASIEAFNLAANFRRSNAGIVVGTIAQLWARHAPVLAREILEEFSANANGKDRTIGEVILRMKQNCMLKGYPIALSVQAVGDSDWKVKNVYN